MTSELLALGIDAADPRDLARFWAELLGWDLADEVHDDVAIVPTDDTGFRIRFRASDRPKTVQNQMHFDLTSTSPDAQQHTVARALALGGRHLDIGQGETTWVVLADPEGNEFCVIESGNNFLADCGFVGAVSCNGSQQVGYFWSAALGWPLVWDQDEETAIRAPYGGPKITWGGPPFPVKTDRNRMRFDLVPDADADAGQQDEVERLVALGATRLDSSGDAVELADPDGNEFCVLPAR